MQAVSHFVVFGNNSKAMTSGPALPTADIPSAPVHTSTLFSMPTSSSDLRNHLQLAPFDYDPRTRVVFGSGSIDQLGTLTKELGDRVLLVTDKGLAEAGHEQHALNVIREAGLNVTVFDDVHPNPTTDDVQRCVVAARDANASVIVGLGGGSSMDCAKGCNFILTNGGRMEDYHGVGKATKPMLPMIAVPTTAGTGSEAQSFALISKADTHEKMACGDRKAACRVAVLDPDLTLSLPDSVAAATGIDAISHAIETFVTTKRNPVSELFSRRAWRLLSDGFGRVFEDRTNIDARAAMLLGAHLAGAAIENSMLGATHALANPLTAHFDVTHGIAIGVMLPHVIRFNASVVGPYYGRLASDVDLCAADNPQASELLAEHVRGLVAGAGAPTTLTELQVDASKIGLLASDAAQQWTGTFNPRPVNESSLQELYQCAF